MFAVNIHRIVGTISLEVTLLLKVLNKVTVPIPRQSII